MEITRTKFYRPHGYGLTEHFTDAGSWIDGSVETRHGYVRAYSEGTHCRPVTTLQMTLKGKNFYACLRRGYTKRGLVTLATRFADQCAEDDTNGR